MMHISLIILVYLPFLAGAVALFCNNTLRIRLTQLVFLAGLCWAVTLACLQVKPLTIPFFNEYYLTLGLNPLSKMILIFINLFGLLISVYSKDYSQVKNLRPYFSYLLWLIACSNLTAVASDFLLFVFAWGMGLTLLYALLILGSDYRQANKALSIVGVGDFMLLLGISMYIYITNTTAMPLDSKVLLNHPLSWAAFILMLAGSFAKAGCMPFHTWIPAVSESAPLPVMALLPGSLDKLLGIYLLARVCNDFFLLNNIAYALLLLIGGFTIICAVMMALIQHDLRKLLSYHAISQVGYMVLGFGTGTLIGMAGAIFHMVNNAIYKSGLFLTGASVGEKKNNYLLENLGGLSRFMPVTFFCALIFSLSISGIPPLNGFASKWMLYQGVVQGLNMHQEIWLRVIFVFALVAAMFGGVLTMASFIKFIHAIFLGEEKVERSRVTEVTFSMKGAVIVLASLCIILGVLPKFLLRNFITGWLSQDILFSGTWNSVISFVLLVSGLLLGFLFWKNSKEVKVRSDSAFTGGEDVALQGRFPATEFYRTIDELPVPRKLYRVLKLESLDPYNILLGLLNILAYCLFIFVDRLVNILLNIPGYVVLGASWVLRKVHTGNLDQYLTWVLIGLLALFGILLWR